MSVRPDNRLEDGPLTQIRCDTCDISVQVRKSSWEQTSIQWDRDAVQSCLERPTAADRGTDEAPRFLGCEALRRSIADAAVRGVLRVMDTSDTPVNPEQGQ